MQIAELLKEKALELGAYKVGEVPVEELVLDTVFRDICESNGCGLYGKCWMCPPDIGAIEDLMAELKTYRKAVVYQTVGQLEDSFDFEGMQEAKAAHNVLSRGLLPLAPDALHLSAGGCQRCRPCAKVKGEPCPFPEDAISSLEAYGIHVSKLAASAGMKYLNGENTVTYFGAIFLK